MYRLAFKNTRARFNRKSGLKLNDYVNFFGLTLNDYVNKVFELKNGHFYGVEFLLIFFLNPIDYFKGFFKFLIP